MDELSIRCMATTDAKAKHTSCSYVRPTARDSEPSNMVLASSAYPYDTSAIRIAHTAYDSATYTPTNRDAVHLARRSGHVWQQNGCSRL